MKINKDLLTSSSQPRTQAHSYNYLKVLSMVITGIGLAALAHYLLYNSTQPVDIIAHLENISKSSNLDVCQDTELYSIICKGNLGIPRIQMPQLHGATLNNYLKFQTDHNITVHSELVHPSTLTPVQSEMDASKIFSLINATISNSYDACNSAILTARNWIIDGHHRFAACSLMNRVLKIISIDKPVTAVLEELKSFQGVFSESLLAK